MDIQTLQALYAEHKSVKALKLLLKEKTVKYIFAEGLCASAAPMAFGAYASDADGREVTPFLFILDDAEEAGYFYHDLTQVLGDDRVFYFPSSFRRAVKFGQRDAAMKYSVPRWSAGWLRETCRSLWSPGPMPLPRKSFHARCWTGRR